MEYIQILGGNFASKIRNFHLSQDDWIKVAIIAAAILVLTMFFTRVKKK